MDDSLEALVISGKELDQKLVAGTLAPYVKLDKDNCTIRPQAAWGGLRADQKILVYLLARKAMEALGFPLKEEAATATEVVLNTGLKKGTAAPALRKMQADRSLNQTKDRKYFVPNHAVETVKDMLTQK